MHLNKQQGGRGDEPFVAPTPICMARTLIYEDSVATGDYDTVEELVDHYLSLDDEGWAEIEWRGDFGHIEGHTGGFCRK